MTEEIVTVPPTVDQQRSDSLYDSYVSTIRQWIDDRRVATDQAIATNMQMFGFYERLLLVNTGTIGISISAIIAFAPKLVTIGHLKIALIVLIICAWGALLVSILLCKLNMMLSLVANDKLRRDWTEFSEDLNGGILSTAIARLAPTFKGTVDVDGKPVDATTNCLNMARKLKQKFDEDARTRPVHNTPTLMESTQKLGVSAVLLMQLAFVLLAIAAVILLVKL